MDRLTMCDLVQVTAFQHLLSSANALSAINVLHIRTLAAPSNATVLT